MSERVGAFIHIAKIIVVYMYYEISLNRSIFCTLTLFKYIVLFCIYAHSTQVVVIQRNLTMYLLFAVSCCAVVTENSVTFSVSQGRSRHTFRSLYLHL